MKNRLFLTSMVAVMLACPAYAEDPYVGTNNCPGGSGNCGVIPEGNSSAPCAENPLTNNGVHENYGTYTLVAKWDADKCPITLNPHTEGYGATGSDPDTLYAIFGGAVYLDSAATNAMSTSAHGLTTLPTGKTFTLTLDPNLPAGYVLSDINSTPGYEQSTTAQMQFKGFYSTQQSDGITTNGNQYISSNGYITDGTVNLSDDGIVAGTSIQSTNGACTSTIWHAQYTCSNASTYTPTLSGYSFEGWFDGVGQYANKVTNFCLTEDKTVHAHWTANLYAPIYVAGTNCSGDMYIDQTCTDPNDSSTCTGNATFRQNYVIKDFTNTGGSGPNITANSGYHLPNAWAVGQTSVAPGSVYSYLESDNVVFTAVCEPNEYTVTYDCNGGTINPALVDAVENGYGVDNVTYNTTLYTFKHQSDLCTYANQTPGDFTCTHTPWFDAQTWNIADNVTCTANWNATAYTITYHCGSLPNNGETVNSGTFENGTNNVDTVYNGTLNYLIKPNTNVSNANGCGTGTQLDGYHFMGWQCDYDLDTGNATSNPMTKYQVNWPAATTVSQTIGTIGLSHNANCYAQWELNTVYLVWEDDNNGVTGSTSHSGGSNSCYYGLTGENFSVPTTAPTKPGYTFKGWEVREWVPSGI